MSSKHGSLFRPPEHFHRFRGAKAHGDIYCGEALSFLRDQPNGSADLLFLDPPFNLGKIYSDKRKHLDKRPESEYHFWMVLVLQEAVRVLAKSGTLFLYHMPNWALRLSPILLQHLEFRNWIAVSMKNGFARGRRLYPAHYALLMFSKGSPRTFRRPRIRPARCRHCDQLVKNYGGYTSIVERKGLNLSDIWEDTSPLRHGSRKYRDANELPPLVFDRIFQMSGRRGGRYVDPFAGAGGGVVHAAGAQMEFACCDILPSNCRLVRDRVLGR